MVIIVLRLKLSAVNLVDHVKCAVGLQNLLDLT